MTHNDFDFYEDLIRPLMRFLCQINILQTYDESDDDDETRSNNSFRQTMRRNRDECKNNNEYNNGNGEPQYQQLKFREDFFIPPYLKSSYM